MSSGWGITSPMALLGEWTGAAAQGNLHDVILLGFTVNLPFLEKTAIRTARDLGARVTVIGDAAQGLYDPVDVRLRTYITGWAACRSAFHPKLALLIGDHDIAAALGSGNPTTAGWGHNDELWAVLRGGPYGSSGALRELGGWLGDLPDVVAMPGYAADVLREAAARLAAVPGDAADGTRVLHNLRQGLLGQLPRSPVRELRMLAPFVDETGQALAGVIAAFDPGRVVIGLQEHLTSYDGDAVLRAAGSRDIEVRLLPERFPRHGKLLEWEGPGGLHVLVGSANLTASALIRATADGGNCELALLASAGESLMPEGTVITSDALGGRRTVKPATPRPRLLLLGALLTHGGVLVTLAKTHDTEVMIETSPDGAPGSWATLGTIEPGLKEKLLPVGATGSVVRAVAVQSGGQRAESPSVFAVSLARCARRQPDDRRPRLRQDYSEETIFTDEEMARQFRIDLRRLIEASTQAASRPTRREEAENESAARDPAEDRWAAYLEECERSIGRPLTTSLFGSLAQMIPGITRGPRWGTGSPNPPDDEPSEDPEPAEADIRPSERAAWVRWAAGLAATAAGDDPGQPAPPFAYRALATRVMIQLLAHGVWESGDESWREGLAQLAASLVPQPGDDEPGPACQIAAALAALCMGLLRSGVPMTVGSPHGALAARAWDRLKPLVADADPDLVADLLISPVHAHAVTLNLSELEETILLAMDDDPAALLTEELARRGWHLASDGLMYRVTGTFTSPLNVAAHVATHLGRSLGAVLVHAQAGSRWAFIAWRRPDLLLASEPGHAWRLYRIDGTATPESRFASAEGIPTAGLIGRPTPFAKGLPPAALELLSAAGADPVEILTHVIRTRSSPS